MPASHCLQVSSAMPASAVAMCFGSKPVIFDEPASDPGVVKTQDVLRSAWKTSASDHIRIGLKKTVIKQAVTRTER
jgi:hypothetical protein